MNIKRFITLLFIFLPLYSIAQQNTWELPEEEEETPQVNPNLKYLEGAVTEKDGKVVFETEILAQGKSARQIYDILLKQAQLMVKSKNQLRSQVAATDSVGMTFAASFEEWLVFKNTSLNLDRTRFYFLLMVQCEDGKAHVEMSRLRYLYEEERDPQNFTAEESITDKYALNKKHTKLLPITGKFRRKTIDRKNYIFNKFESLLTK